MNCLLVSSAKTTGGFEYFINIQNLALASIAGNVDKKKCEVKILDLVAVRFKAKPYFTNYITQNHFDIIGFSAMVFQFHEILDLAKIAKEHNPKVITVIGGYYATVCADELLISENMKYFDFIIRGEGEIAFRKLIDELCNEQNFSRVPGISYVHNVQIINNPCEELTDLSLLNFPDRDSRVLKEGFSIMGYNCDVIETSRGCTYTCNFCSITKMYGRSFRRFSIDRIINEIKTVKKNGAEAVFFTDDNITLSVHHFEELANRIINENLNDIKYFTQASIKGFKDSPHLPQLFRKAGFEWVFLGIESNSDESLEYFNKDNQLKSADVELVVKSLKKEKLFVFGGMILGNPNDSWESINASYDFINRLGVDYAVFSTLTPFPGTKLREELIKQNYITNMHDYSTYDTYNVNIRTHHLSALELYEAIDSLIQKYFFDSGAIYRLIKRYPKFFIKQFFNFLIFHPDMVFHHLTQGKFLKKKRERKFAMTS